MASDANTRSNGAGSGARPGRIELICGSMFAGKTTALIERIRAAAGAGERAVALKHATDCRYHDTALATHNGRTFEARPVANGAEVLAAAADFDVIGLDEVHFFDFELVRACVALRDAGKTVILAGLDHDMWGREFPWITRLKALADLVQILSAPCSVCGGAARFSQRMTPYHGDIVGGPEAYEPRCERCFTPLDLPAPAYSES